MTPDRWRQVEALYQEARRRPVAERVAFVTQSCRQDESLRRDVESLLNEPVSDDGFLHPSPGAAAHAPPDAIAARLGGELFGRYQLSALLGAGGMGEVYRARDNTLGREVAIKVLPAEFTANVEQRARLDREARILATLNHRHIGAIYGVEEADGVRALILELVEGDTLAERVSMVTPDAASHPAGLPMPAALFFARQIADALEAAHEKGIVHRDLKPANIKITPDGDVKVLDFGLAKAASTENCSHLDLGESSVGAILGTAAYMSPEQARGHSVDKRADIWAFGCVLYEMLTGRLVFPGDTVSDTIAKILEREPDWSALPRATPASIRRLLLRCLSKDPKQRLRDIGEARIEIDAIGEAGTGLFEGPVSSSNRAAINKLWLAATGVAGVIVLAAAASVWPGLPPVRSQEDPLADARFSVLVNWEGTEEGAEISPDGEFVAFLADRDGRFDIWLTRVGTGVFSNLTSSLAPLTPSGSIVRKLGFSGDGKDIWFNPGYGQAPMLMPATGGTPRPFLRKGTNTPAWSPDAASLVYIDKANRDDPIYLADRSGGDARAILAAGTLKNVNPVWSPDGEWIYFVRGSEPQDEVEMDVWRLRPSGGTPERMTSQHLAINFLAPLDRRRLLYVARAEDRSGPWLWSLDVHSGVSRRVPSGVDQYTSVSTSRDGRRVVATVANPSASLWRVPLLDRVADERDAQPYPLPEPMGMAIGPRVGNASLFYLSTGGTTDGLWTVQDGKASQLRRSADGALSEPPAVSPDGRIAVVVRREGKRHLSISSADGTNAHTFAASIEIEGAAGQGAVDWSPDATRIVTGGRDEKGPALFIIPVSSGVPVRFIEGQWVNPVWSPRGDLIVYAGRSVIGQVELCAVQPDGTPVDLPHVVVRPGGYRFLPDGTGLVYLPRIQSPDFWLLDFATKKSRPLTRLGNRGSVRTFDVTRDGKYIVFDRTQQNSNIVLIERRK